MRRFVGLLILSLVSWSFAGGCDLVDRLQQLCPEPHVATASTADLLEELLGRGWDGIWDD